MDICEGYRNTLRYYIHMMFIYYIILCEHVIYKYMYLHTIFIYSMSVLPRQFFISQLIA